MWLINWKLHFPEWKRRSFVVKISPRILKITSSGFEISKFSGAEHTQTPFPALPPPPTRKRGPMIPCWYSRLLYSNLLATSISNPFIQTPLLGTLLWSVCICLQAFPAPQRPTFTDWEIRGRLCEKYSATKRSTVFSEPKFGPPCPIQSKKTVL